MNNSERDGKQSIIKLDNKPRQSMNKSMVFFRIGRILHSLVLEYNIQNSSKTIPIKSIENTTFNNVVLIIIDSIIKIGTIVNIKVRFLSSNFNLIFIIMT
jgi:hypothetical protein